MPPSRLGGGGSPAPAFSPAGRGARCRSGIRIGGSLLLALAFALALTLCLAFGLTLRIALARLLLTLALALRFARLRCASRGGGRLAWWLAGVAIVSDRGHVHGDGHDRHLPCHDVTAFLVAIAVAAMRATIDGPDRVHGPIATTMPGAAPVATITMAIAMSVTARFAARRRRSAALAAWRPVRSR